MTDAKPPRIAGTDRDVLCALLRYQRESFVRKVTGVVNDAARTSPVASGTNLLWLAQHMADAEHTWIIARFAGRAIPQDLAEAPESIIEAIGRYRRTWSVVDDIIASANMSDLCHDREPPVDLRWILAHLLEETARHAGHADILRELIDGSTGR